MRTAALLLILLAPLSASSKSHFFHHGGIVTRINFKVMGKKWTLRVLTRKKYDKLYGSDSLATTIPHLRRIDLRPEGTDQETVRHELVHAFFSESGTNSASLDSDAFEEIAAEIFSKRGDEILKQADELVEEIHET